MGYEISFCHFKSKVLRKNTHHASSLLNLFNFVEASFVWGPQQRRMTTNEEKLSERKRFMLTFRSCRMRTEFIIEILFAHVASICSNFDNNGFTKNHFHDEFSLSSFCILCFRAAGTTQSCDILPSLQRHCNALILINWNNFVGLDGAK